MTATDPTIRTGGDDLIEPLAVRTYSQLAYDELRRRILDGRLAPGTKIIVRVLAEELGLSPTPIKNALAALQTEGFLETIAYRGYSVPLISAKTLAEAFELLEALDVFAARKIAASPDRDAIADRLEQLVSSGTAAASPREWSGYEMDFHKLMWQSADNAQLVAAAERQRGIVLVASGGLLEVPERRTDVRAEHLAIIAALRSGNVKEVSEVCSQHMRESAGSAGSRLAERKG